MTFARLLAGAFLVCSAPTLAQNQPSLATPATANLAPDAGIVTGFAPCCVATMSAEPWRIIPKPPIANAETNPVYRLPANDSETFHFNDDGLVRLLRPDPDARTFNSILEPQSNAETTCLSIRSYLVARDSKDSDSTHPTGYSTCQPSDRYRLKSTEIRVESPDR